MLQINVLVKVLLELLLLVVVVVTKQHFIVISSGNSPLNGSEDGGDLVLIQTFLLFCVN